MTTDQPKDPARERDELVEKLLRKQEEDKKWDAWTARYRESYDRRRREEDRWRYPLAVALGFVAGVIVTLAIVWLARFGSAS